MAAHPPQYRPSDFTIEVHEPDLNTWYPAVVLDCNAKGVTVAFDRGLRENQLVDFARIRLAPDTHERVKPQVGLMVEVLTEGDRDSPPCYWRATVIEVKDDVVAVHYDGWEDYYNELVKVERIRYPNASPIFSSANIYKAVIDIQPHLISYFERDEILQPFKKKCGLWAISINAPLKQFTVMGSKAAVEKAQLLREIHFEYLENLKKLEEYKMKAASQIEDLKQHGFTIDVCLPEHLVGLAIGKGGANIKSAQKINGIHNIDVVDNGDGKGRVFRIVAKTAEAAKEAQAMLTIVESDISIPRKFVSRIVGAKGRNLQELTEKAGVARITVEDDRRNDDKSVLHVVGRKENVDIAFVLIDGEMTLHAQTEQLEEEYARTNKELRDVGVTSGYSRNYYGGRGGESAEPESDGSRQSRGRGRGGLRGGRGGGSGMSRGNGQARGYTHEEEPEVAPQPAAPKPKRPSKDSGQTFSVTLTGYKKPKGSNRNFDEEEEVAAEQQVPESKPEKFSKHDRYDKQERTGKGEKPQKGQEKQQKPQQSTEKVQDNNTQDVVPDKAAENAEKQERQEKQERPRAEKQRSVDKPKPSRIVKLIESQDDQVAPARTKKNPNKQLTVNVSNTPQASSPTVSRNHSDGGDGTNASGQAAGSTDASVGENQGSSAFKGPKATTWSPGEPKPPRSKRYSERNKKNVDGAAETTDATPAAVSPVDATPGAVVPASQDAVAATQAATPAQAPTQMQEQTNSVADNAVAASFVEPNTQPAVASADQPSSNE